MAQSPVNPVIISIIVVVLIGAGAGAFYLLGGDDESVDTAERRITTSTTVQGNSTATTDESTQEVASTSEAVTTEVSSSDYKDGTYTATGSYSTPGGTEEVKVTVVLKNDVVTSVTTVGSATRGDSARYQSKFLSAYESKVSGKDIDSVSLSRVAGSSLTSNGFNKAITIIKNEAMA